MKHCVLQKVAHISTFPANFSSPFHQIFEQRAGDHLTTALPYFRRNPEACTPRRWSTRFMYINARSVPRHHHFCFLEKSIKPSISKASLPCLFDWWCASPPCFGRQWPLEVSRLISQWLPAQVQLRHWIVSWKPLIARDCSIFTPILYLRSISSILYFYFFFFGIPSPSPL